MIHISAKAEEALNEYFKETEPVPIRIILQGGCGGAHLVMVLDEPGEADEVFKVNGYTMVVDRELHEKTKDITVDYVHSVHGSGFRVESAMPVSGGEGCSSGCCC